MRSPPLSEAEASTAAPAPFARLPHRYETQPTSLYATHTYVDPNLDLDSLDGPDGSNSVNDDLIAQLKTLLRLRLEEEKREEQKAENSVRKKEISEVRSRNIWSSISQLIAHFVTG